MSLCATLTCKISGTVIGREEHMILCIRTCMIAGSRSAKIESSLHSLQVQWLVY